MIKKRIFISCIEASADLFCAHIIKKIPSYAENYHFYGFGGKYLKQCGAEIISDFTVKSTMGFLEPLFQLFFFLKKLNLAKQTLAQNPPEALWVVDGQGFHLPLIKFAKEKLKIPVIYLIAPQTWQWGKTKQAHKFIKHIDLIIDIYSEATQFYQKLHPHAHWIGHPLVDIVRPTLSQEEFLKKYNLPSDKPIIGIFPGSRTQEVKRLLPLFMQTTFKMSAPYYFLISCAHPDLKK